MKKRHNQTIAGINAPPARPTVLGAALFAAIVTFPIGVVIVVIDTLLI